MTNTEKNNTGYSNTGNRNTGNSNTGYRNTGYRNTGNWNTTNQETGYFNTTQSDIVRVFNKDCPRGAWDNADKPSFLYFNLTEWIPDTDMTDKEKIDNETFHTTGGYLKTYEYKEAFQKAYSEASQEDKDKLLKLPNFDAEVFKEISGIDIADQSCAGKIVEIDGKKYKLQEI